MDDDDDDDINCDGHTKAILKNRHETGIFPVLQNLTHICVFSQFKLNTEHAVPVPGASPDLKEI